MKLRNREIVKTDFPLPACGSKKQQQKQKQQQQQQVEPVWGRFQKLDSPAGGEFYISQHILVEDPPDIGRHFAVVKYFLKEKPCFQLFYRSSGYNTKMAHTWFPTDGLVVEPGSGAGTGLVYRKLQATSFSKTLMKETRLASEIVRLGLDGLDTETGVVNSLLGRFGCPIMMYISYLLGGSLWSNKDLCRLFTPYMKIDVKLPTRPERPLEKHTVSIIASKEDVNRFARYAVSVNYIQDEYEQVFPYFYNYEELYSKAYEVGTNLKDRLGILRCETPLFFEYKDTKYILGCFLDWNIQNVGCDNVKNLIRHVRVRAESGLVYGFTDC